jgi:hypothetical protein
MWDLTIPADHDFYIKAVPQPSSSRFLICDRDREGKVVCVWSAMDGSCARISVTGQGKPVRGKFVLY